MQIANLNPKVTPWKQGQTLKASSWTAVDRSYGTVAVREIFHYGTMMGKFVVGPYGSVFGPTSTGWGSASDQQGIRKLDCGFRMVRKGGSPRYEEVA